MPSLSNGRRLLEADPGHRVDVHRSIHPPDLDPLHDVVGQVFTGVLRGEDTLRFEFGRSDDFGSLFVSGLSDSQTEFLDDRFRPDESRVPGRPPTGGVERWALDLPRAVRAHVRLAQNWADAQSWVRFDHGAAMFIRLVVSPVMQDLAGVFRVRRGEGPQTRKGRRDVVDRCLLAHRTLGLDPCHVVDLLDPELRAQEVGEVRERIVSSWADCPPDIGARVVTYQCAQLAGRYYSKARKDGTAPRHQVLTSATEPLLRATLQDWDDLLAYLGERLADADAVPIPVPSIPLPLPTPPLIAGRLDVLRRWWEAFDLGQRERELGDAVSADEMLSARDPDTSQNPFGPSVGWAEHLPTALVDDIRSNWGSTVLARHPNVIVSEFEPQDTMLDLVDPAGRFWDEIGRAAWQNCAYGRGLGHDNFPDYFRVAQGSVTESGFSPDELLAALKDLDDEFSALIQKGSVRMGMSVGQDDRGEWHLLKTAQDHDQGAVEMYRRMRDLISRYRRIWIDNDLEDELDRVWRRDLESVADRYNALLVGRGGKPPTIKQCIGIVREAAVRWFGGDVAALAAVLRLDGPVCAPMTRTERMPPDDMSCVRRVVCQLLGGSPEPDEPDRRRRHRCELSNYVPNVIALWQATGQWPTRVEVFGSHHWLLESVYGDDVDDGYGEFLASVHAAVETCGSSA